MHTVTKNAIEAFAIAFSCGVPWNDNRMATIIIDMAAPKAPPIMGFFRPQVSSLNAGIREPTVNAKLRNPLVISAVLRGKPTFVSSTVGA